MVRSDRAVFLIVLFELAHAQSRRRAIETLGLAGHKNRFCLVVPAGQTCTLMVVYSPILWSMIKKSKGLFALKSCFAEINFLNIYFCF